MCVVLVNRYLNCTEIASACGSVICMIYVSGEYRSGANGGDGQTVTHARVPVETG